MMNFSQRYTPDGSPERDASSDRGGNSYCTGVRNKYLRRRFERSPLLYVLTSGNEASIGKINWNRERGFDASFEICRGLWR